MRIVMLDLLLYGKWSPSLLFHAQENCQTAWYSHVAQSSLQVPILCIHIAMTIWNEKAKTCITRDICEDLNFIPTVFSNPITYRWSSPITHLIPWEPDYKYWQDPSL
jgi:hypothetical protein